MSTKIQCDKCGDLLKPDFYITTISVHTQLNKQWFAEKYDLCPECTKKLIKWLEVKND